MFSLAKTMDENWQKPDKRSIQNVQKKKKRCSERNETKPFTSADRYRLNCQILTHIR